MTEVLDKLSRVMPEIDSVHRPWGYFDQFAHNEKVTVSLMHVNPGQRLSLQSHENRAELWIVFDEGAKIQVDSEEKVYGPGDRVWIPAGSKHRLTCSGKTPVRVLEVAFGDWAIEDIKRFQDDYKRSESGE
ncbi:phosphomannose isomerase type II C-terminal cupin domain [Lentisphaerota bacterium ZTH]|nr:phosphomannose isomerase type II C-terminal cupin domain [Lentisphaerota bacterium]WET05239.1 phosphomannose isomerase type II C-terminal cupin domain [Lentisphaerota bacterium ZTH]